MSNKTKSREQTFSDLSTFVTFRIARVQNALNAHAIATLAAHCDLTLTEWRMLASVEYRSKTTAAEIVRHTQIDKGQVSRAIKLLRERGLLDVVENDIDHRRQTLSLSQQGRETFEKIVVVMRKRQATLTENISEDDLKTVFSVLDRLEAKVMDTSVKR